MSIVSTLSSLIFSHHLSCLSVRRSEFGFKLTVIWVIAAIQGYDEANKFVACLCVGNTSDGSSGADTFQQTADFCGGCSTTPERIREDIAVSWV